MPPGRIEAHDPPVFVDDLQAPAHVDGRRCYDLPAIDQGELGRAAADVDVENAFA